MSILHWVGQNLLNVIIGIASAIGLGVIIVFVSRKGLRLASDFIVKTFLNTLKTSLKKPEDLALAKEAVRWVEIKFPDKPSDEKRRLAVGVIRKWIPILTESLAGELVEMAVTQINMTLKEIEDKI